MIYSIDLDLPKRIFACHNARNVQGRRSASRQGFHFRWQCSHTCKRCREIEKRFDDETRQRLDKRRIPGARRVLWTRKDNEKPTRWESFSRHGTARQGGAGHGKAGQGKARLGTAWRGKARLGVARLGVARLGKAGRGKAWQGK